MAPNLKVKDWKPESSVTGLFESSITGLAGKLGLGSLLDGSALEGLQALTERPLDGLFSIWHPE